jgi:hypothetical protein
LRRSLKSFTSRREFGAFSEEHAMKRFLALLALGFLVFRSDTAGAPTVIGDLNNFDTLNDTGQICYGFEIEIDDIRSTDITYTFDWNHYGAPKIREDLTDPTHSKVFVRYESTKDASGNWGANGSFTNVAIPTITPPQGHTCTDTSVNEGCEHFGVGYYGTPTTIKYNWLVDIGGGNLGYFGSPVNVATPTWVYTPPVGGQPANAVAAIPAPVVPIAPGMQYGEPSWVKVIKTTTHSANPLALRDLVSSDDDGDGLADWQHGEPGETETEWKLLQANSAGDANKDELQGAADDMGDGSETVTRRYEFYRYGAAPDTFDGETGEAMCSEVNPTTDPADPYYLHGVGNHVAVTDANGDTYYVDCEVQVVVGNYVGAQMAGFDAEAGLGLIDHLQDGEINVPYTARTVVIGGVPPYIVDIVSFALPPGLSISNLGVLTGTPTASGDFSFTVGVTDSAAIYVSATYSLHVVGPVTPPVTLAVEKSGSGSGTVTGNGIDCGVTCSTPLDTGTSVALTATPDTGSIFSGWSGPCAGTGNCIFDLAGASTVTATFTRQWQLSVSVGGSGTGVVAGNGVDCGAACVVLLDAGTAVTLTATPTNGSIFLGWTGDCSGTGTCTTTMDGDRTVSVNFASPTHLFGLSATIAGPGTIASSPKGLNCGKQCSASFPIGTSVTLSIKITKKHTFLGWTGACSSSGTLPDCTVIMMKDEVVGARFN